MRELIRNELTKLLLSILILASGAGAQPFTSGDTGVSPCAGDVTIASGGVVTCATGGVSLLSSCTGNIVIDSAGVVRCSVMAVPPACTLEQSLSAGAIILTAQCNPAATSYIWSANTGLASTQSSGRVSPQPVMTTTYTVQGVNAAGTAGEVATLEVIVGATSGVPSCSLIASPSSISPGSSVTLTASCSPAATSYNWTGSVCSRGAHTCTVTPTGSTTYSVSGTNASGTGSVASASVTVTAASGPPVCTLTQSLFAGQVALTAQCYPAATSYNWSANAGLTSTQSGGPVSPQPVMTTTYSVSGTNSKGTSSTVYVEYIVSTPTPTCTLAADPTAVDANGTSILTATCSPVPTSYTWSANTGFSTSSSSGTVTLGATEGTETYTVTGSNVAGAGNQASATVKVSKPVCTVTPPSPSIEPGGSSLLEARCIPDATGGYLWTGGNCEGATASTCNTGVLNASADYTVTGSNSLGAGTPATVRVTVAKPTCTLTAVPPLVARGQESILTASCSPAVSGNYTWTGGTCAGITASSTCNVTPLVAGAVDYTVKGDNSAGTSNVASATVTAAAPSCTLTASPSTISPGSSSTLTASCSPGATQGYVWTGGTCAGTTASSCIVSPSATTSYSVAGKDKEGAGTAASATVSVVSDPGCPSGYFYRTVNVTWAANGWKGSPLHRMGHCEVIAFRIDSMPARDYGPSQTVYATTPKYMTLSQSPYDFSPALRSNGCGGGGANNPTIWSSTVGRENTCSTTEGETYYLNVRNSTSYDGPDNCQAGDTCTFYLAW